MSDTSKKYNSLVSYHYPAVSVIIPMYNAEKYIGECLNSLLLQTFQDFEVIVVDDCSTDNSVVAAEKYIPKFNGRLRIFSMKKNTGGAALPRNKALVISKGEYIYFLDSDDFIMTNALETFYVLAKKYDADVVYTGSYYRLSNPNDIYLNRDNEGKKLLAQGMEDKSDFRIGNQKENLNKLILENGNARNPWTKFIRREFLIQNEIYFPRIPIGEDFIWCINVYCHADRFLRISKPLCFYRDYNATSVTRTKNEPSKQIAYWISMLVDFMKNLNALENENKILSENHDYCFTAFKGHFEWCLALTNSTRNNLSSRDIYEALYREFSTGSFDVTVPFFFSFIDSENKSHKNNLQIINDLKKEVVKLKNSPPYPVISVIIPLYNTEKYIGECLDSLLNQTFKNFEIIVVDDCSTDNSAAIVESYAPKFEGRLIFTKLKKNSGGGGYVPRNKGLLFSRGEYIFFMDADDMITRTALEELCTLAKNYDTDVVYCENFYEINLDGKNSKIKSYQSGGFVDKPTFEPEDLKERVQKIIAKKYLTVPWNKLVKRNLIIANELFFPLVKTSGDNIWNQTLLFHAKKFLRVPNIIYMYRKSEGSAQRTKRTPQQHINFWLNPVLLGLKYLDNMMSQHEFFNDNPDCRFALLKKFVNTRFAWTLGSAKKLEEDIIYSTIKEEFGEKLGNYDVLIPALCTVLYNEKIPESPTNDNEEILDSDAETLRNFKQYFMARLDIKLLTKNKSDFQIISISDDRADVRKPDWFNKDGVGYQIQSYVGKLDMVFNVIEGGMISLGLRGLDMRNPKETSKRIPYWVDYTKLIVNDKVIFDEVTPAWHDKPFRYDMVARAGEDISISVEWLPHRSDN